VAAPERTPLIPKGMKPPLPRFSFDGMKSVELDAKRKTIFAQLIHNTFGT